MRMLSGNPRARKWLQNLWTEAKELRSISNTIISASGLSFWIASFTWAAFFKSLAGITILTPLFANTLAVSAPIPEVAPFQTKTKNKKIKFYFSFFLTLCIIWVKFWFIIYIFFWCVVQKAAIHTDELIQHIGKYNLKRDKTISLLLI